MRMEKVVTACGVGRCWLSVNSSAEEHSYTEWLNDLCVNKASTGWCTRHNISSREENIVSIVQTLAKTSSGVLLTVLVTFVKKN